MDPNSLKGTMQPLASRGGAGHFGLKKNVSAPPMRKEEVVGEEMADEIKEGQPITEIKDETITGTMETPEESKNKMVEENENEVDESYECPVCHKGFKARIGLAGHMRTHKE